jgi:DNA-binding GntR family transcriptional regulator
MTRPRALTYDRLVNGPGDSTSEDGARPSAPLAARPKLGEEVTRVLREEILTGAIPARERLATDEIARRLGVSSMPVREALAVLESEGIVETLPRRGYRVAPIRRRDIEDSFLVHSFLAGTLARRACVSVTDELLAQLRQLQVEIEAAVARLESTDSAPGSKEAEYELIEDLNFTFHRAINEAADGHRLRWFLRASFRFVPRRYYITTPGWIAATLEDHPEILDALEARDPDRTDEAMRAHILKGGRLVLEGIETV